MQGRTQVAKLQKPAQNIVGQCHIIHPTAPIDFHLFGAMKNAICKNFETDDDMIHAVRTWLCQQDKTWYQQGIYTFFLHWQRPQK
jgi:hypothetical protein